LESSYNLTSNNNKKNLNLFRKGFQSVVDISQINEYELMKCLQCPDEKNMGIFRSLIVIELVKDIHDDDEKKLLNWLIEIVSVMSPKNRTKFFKWYSASKCCPNSININFHSNKLFRAHTCSNGLDIPRESRFHLPFTKLTFKDDLYTSLEIPIE